MALCHRNPEEEFTFNYNTTMDNKNTQNSKKSKIVKLRVGSRYLVGRRSVIAVLLFVEAFYR